MSFTKKKNQKETKVQIQNVNEDGTDFLNIGHNLRKKHSLKHILINVYLVFILQTSVSVLWIFRVHLTGINFLLSLPHP